MRRGVGDFDVYRFAVFLEGFFELRSIVCEYRLRFLLLSRDDLLKLGSLLLTYDDLPLQI